MNDVIERIVARIPEGEKRIMVAEQDSSADYEVDIDQLWVDKNGQLIWRYASGCSCWDGEYSEEHVATIKEFVVMAPAAEWEAALAKFAETGEEQSL